MYIKLKNGIKVVKRNCSGSFEGRIALNCKDGIYYLNDEYFNFFEQCDGKTNLKLLSGSLHKILSYDGKQIAGDNNESSLVNKIMKSDLVDYVDILIQKEVINPSQVLSLSKKQVAPCIWCIWELTRKCNAKCQHCYQVINGKRDLESKLDYTKEQISKSLENLNMLGVQEIKFTGGEITVLGQGLLEYIFNKCNELAMPFRLNSNGFNDLKFLISLKRNSPYFRGLQISLDGYGKIHDKFRGVSGMFEKISSNVKLIKDEVPLQFVTMIHSGLLNNEKEVDRLVGYVTDNAISWLLETPADIGNWKFNNGSAKGDKTIVELSKLLIKKIIKKNNNFNFTIARIFDHSFTEDLGCVEVLCGHHQDMINISPGGISFCVPFKNDLPKYLNEICQPYDDFNKVLQSWNLISKTRVKGNLLCNKCSYIKLCKGGCPGQYSNSKLMKGCDMVFKNKAKIIANIYLDLSKDKDFLLDLRGSIHEDYFNNMLKLFK